MGSRGIVERNKKTIEQYIRNQPQEDIFTEQISMKEYIDLFTDEPVEGSK